MKQAVILAGGKGTRLRDISGHLPKPMTSIFGKPLLQHIVEECAKYNFSDIKLLVSYKKEIIKDYFGDGKKYGVSIEYICETKARGTAGALLDALTILDEHFLVLYGDTYFDIDLNSFKQFHKDHNGDASIFLHPNDHPYDSDLVQIDSHNLVQKIHSYPHDNQWRQNLVNAAVYIFNKTAFKGINLNSIKSDIAKDLFPTMIASRKRIYGYLSTEYIKDMGTPNRLSKLEIDIKTGKVLKLKKSSLKTAIFLDRDGTINREVNHLSEIDQFELIEGAAEAIHKINAAGILVVIVTNQPVIARGELKETELKEIHNKMDTLLGQKGAYIDRLYYCPHHTDAGFEGEVKSLKINCECRKPKIGLLKRAERDLNIKLEQSWLVGDSTSDIMTACNAGMKSVLVKTGFAGKDGKHELNPVYIANNLNDAIDLILKKIDT